MPQHGAEMSRLAGCESAPQFRRPLSPAAWKCLLAALCLAVFSGCCWTDKHGTHHLIVGLGFGVITTTNRVGVDVRDSRILGAEIGPDGVGVGWAQHHRVAIDPAMASNVVVSIKANPFGLTVKNFDPYSAPSKTRPEPTPERKSNQ